MASTHEDVGADTARPTDAAQQAASAMEASTRAGTIAQLMAQAAERHRDKPAISFKRDGEWRQLTYGEVGAIVEEVALGLVELGLQPGERLCILAKTRPEWTYVDFAAAAAGAVVVPIYATNSPQECAWVAANSGACVIVCEDAAQLAKIEAVRDQLPALRTLVVIEPPAAGGDSDSDSGAAADPGAAAGPDSAADPGAVADPDSADAEAGQLASGAVLTLAQLRERGRRGDRAALAERRDAVHPEDPYTFIYTSGTTGPPKGCVLTHANFRAVIDMTILAGAIHEGESIYLYLPLAHAFARLVQLSAIDTGLQLAYFSGDTQQIIAELNEIRPSFLPSVPRIFEKIYAFVTGAIEHAPADEQQRFREAIAVGLEVRALQAAGKPVPAELQERFDAADERLYRNVRAAFGGNLRQAISGAAPIAREILEFFCACGVPVLEAYGLTETSTAASLQTVDDFRLGTVGRALPGTEIRIAEDGEILLKGPHIFVGYYQDEAATREVLIDGWLHTGDLGELDDDGFLTITGRKKDIIITAGGKNLTPANVENDLKRSRWISQAVMFGDRRPYPVALITLDEETIVPWAREHGLPEDVPSLARDPQVRALIQSELDTVNAHYASVAQIKRFAILDQDLSQDTGELTPTLKVKRNVVADKFADAIAAVYDAPDGHPNDASA